MCWYNSGAEYREICGVGLVMGIVYIPFTKDIIRLQIFIKAAFELLKKYLDFESMS